MGQESGAGAARTFLEDLSRDLTHVAILLARYAHEDAVRRESAVEHRVTARQVQAVLAARYARSPRFGLDVANPGWSLLLELFLAYLEKRPVRMARLATSARVAMTTALRWVDQLSDADFVRRQPSTERQGGVDIVLTEAGVDAMEDYFVSIQVGWALA
jgi:predicted transcriptional regulator